MLAIALAIPAVVAGCGGGSSSNNEDPQKVLDETFNNPTKITSGKLDVSISGSAEGDQSGDFSASISGPFQTTTDQTAFPELDLTANISASSGGPSLSFDGSLITTKDNAYVEYQDQAYEVGTDAFKQFEQAYAQAAKQNQSKSGGNAFSQFGIDPSTWLTNVTNEGTTSVEGADTIQIHGDADVGQIVSDLQKISQQTGSASTPQITPQQLDQLKSSVKDASIDVYSGTDDHLLRKLSLSLSLAPPASTGSSVSSVNVDFSLTLSDVNQPQTITAPSNAKPLSDLLGQFGLPGLPGVGGSTGGFSFPGGASGGGGGANPAYFKCVQKAGSDPAKVSACASKLQ
jgi:hypothetical protein